MAVMLFVFPKTLRSSKLLHCQRITLTIIASYLSPLLRLAAKSFSHTLTTLFGLWWIFLLLVLSFWTVPNHQLPFRQMDLRLCPHILSTHFNYGIPKRPER